MQQPPIPIPHTFTDFLWLLLASFFVTGGGAAWWAAWKNRKRPSAEIHETEARTAKQLAEARSLDLQSNITAGDAVLRMVQQLTFDQIAIEKLNAENERLANENERYETQMRRAKALLKLHKINWDDSAG